MAAANSDCGDRIMESILSWQEDVPTTEEVLREAAANPHCGGEIMETILSQREDEIRITADVLETAVKHYSGRDPALSVILNSQGVEINISQEVLVTAPAPSGEHYEPVPPPMGSLSRYLSLLGSSLNPRNSHDCSC